MKMLLLAPALLLLSLASPAQAQSQPYSSLSMESWARDLGEGVLPGGRPTQCSDIVITKCKSDAEVAAVGECQNEAGLSRCLADPSQSKVVWNGIISKQTAERFGFSPDQALDGSGGVATYGCICQGTAYSLQ